MSRIPYLDDAAMTPRQLHRSQELAASRGGGRVVGPGAFWVYNPAISDVAEPLRLHMERATSLPHGLSELAILITARHWSATYAWCRHEPQALKDGIEATAIAALKVGATPIFADPPSDIVYRVAAQLLRTGHLDDATYAAALDAFGLASLVDLVTMVGYGSQVSLVNATFEPDAPAGATDYLPPGAPHAVPPARPLTLSNSAEVGLIGAAARAWAHCPTILERVRAYDAVLRRDLVMPAAASWLIVLLLARYWSAQSLWPSLYRQALAQGLDARIADAVARGLRPDGLSDVQAGVYDFAYELLHDGRPSEATFARVRDQFGYTTMIETASIIGTMTIIALPANVFTPGRI